MKKSQNIIDIIPIARIPLSRNQSFSYVYDKKLESGTLVTIPLFRRKVAGVVTGHRPDFERLGNIELKKIDSVVAEKFLTENQLELARFISDHYICPLGIVLKSFIPKIVKERKRKETTVREKDPDRKIKLTNEQENAVNKITSKNNSKSEILNSKFLLYGPASSGKTEIYIHSILKLKEKDPELQFLILLPELTLTPQAIERYGEYFSPQETVVLHSKISKGEFYTGWQKIKSGEAKIIIGSRMAVFAPFQKLGLIAVDEEQDMSFKQWDMNPRYDARTVAEKLAELHKSKIIFGSATPRVESYYKASLGGLELLTLPILKLSTAGYQPPATHIELVDMKKERWVKNYSFISKKLQSEIAYALKNKLQAIIFINRQGMSSFSICTECKTVLRCPKCERALIYDNKGIYKCVHCAYQSSITPECSKCKNITFTNIGLGTQKIEKEMHERFPGARVARADNQSMQAPHAREKLYENFKNGQIDILVGTQMISKGWDLPNVALIGIIDADGMLGIPDFTAEERAYQNLNQIAGRAGRIGAKFPGDVLIQTFNPEQKFFRMLVAGKHIDFFEKELKERQELGLPPFGKLIKLVFQDYAVKKTTIEAERVFGLLTEKISKYARISEPQDAFLANIRGRFRKQIIIKLSDTDKIPQEIKAILAALPVGWIVDVDPISII
jgi:primosomal protein N' (replication factor Y) (superfamily II helicase)